MFIQPVLFLFASLFSDSLQLVADSYKIKDNGQDFAVIDLYVDVPGAGNAVFSVFSSQISLSGAESWFHDDLQGSCPEGGTWLPVAEEVFSPVDSWVTIGAMPSEGNFTGLDPLFDDSPACSSSLSENAGWFNSYPPSLQGAAKNYVLHNGQSLNSAVLIGRFVVKGIPSSPAFLNVANLGVKWGSLLTPSSTSFVSESFQYALANDIDGNGAIDGADLGALIGSWGACVDSLNCAADLNGDGVVDATDLGILLAAWNPRK